MDDREDVTSHNNIKKYTIAINCQRFVITRLMQLYILVYTLTKKSEHDKKNPM